MTKRGVQRKATGGVPAFPAAAAILVCCCDMKIVYWLISSAVVAIYMKELVQRKTKRAYVETRTPRATLYLVEQPSYTLDRGPSQGRRNEEEALAQQHGFHKHPHHGLVSAQAA